MRKFTEELHQKVQLSIQKVSDQGEVGFEFYNSCYSIVKAAMGELKAYVYRYKFKDKWYQKFRVEDSIQNAKVYAFYKKSNKYYSDAEVGELVGWQQRIVLSHYDNIELRQTFFKNLLENAVQESRLEKTGYVHFILRTYRFHHRIFGNTACRESDSLQLDRWLGRIPPPK